MSSVQGLQITPEGRWSLIEFPTHGVGNEDARIINEAVGGYFETVMILDGRGDYIMWVNEDGSARDLPFNYFASLIAIAYTPQVLGTVVITGGPRGDGGFGPLPPTWVDAWESRQQAMADQAAAMRDGQ